MVHMLKGQSKGEVETRCGLKIAVKDEPFTNPRIVSGWESDVTCPECEL